MAPPDRFGQTVRGEVRGEGSGLSSFTQRWGRAADPYSAGAALAAALVIAVSSSLILWTPGTSSLSRADAGPLPLRAATLTARDPKDEPAGGEARSAGSLAKRTALIVGINSAAGSRKLLGAVRDAQLLHDALLRYGFAPEDVTLLLERDATAGSISAELDALAARTPADGRAVFAFAGHTRKRGAANFLVAADGRLIPVAELATRLGRVTAPMWVVLPTCYAGAYARPGITGPGRVATFAARANELAYELGGAGSYLMIHMVERAMLGGAAPESVERAFAYAEGSIRAERPNRVPYIDDQLEGELVLGPVTWLRPAPRRAPVPASSGRAEPAPPPAEPPEPPPGCPPDRPDLWGVLGLGCG